MTYIEKMAQILRTPKEVILDVEKKMETKTGKKGVLEQIQKEIEEKSQIRLKSLGVYPETAKAKDVYNDLINKTRKEDEALFKLLREPKFETLEGCSTLIHVAKEVFRPRKGFFLKEKKAKELLTLNPPQKIIELYDYNSVDGLLNGENIFDIFASLRFVEDDEWLNSVFFKPYADLKESDFEEREIQVYVVSEHIAKLGKKFIGKKLHHLSHLKELGIVFIMPFRAAYPGATLEVFSLVLHYLHEIDFYSNLFRKYSKEANFGTRMKSAMEGKVLEDSLSKNKNIWRIVQRYLAKIDPHDPRLFEPHINPEVIHWAKAEKNLKEFGERFVELDLEFFGGMDFVGEFFPVGINQEPMLISFDLIDNIISLSKRSTLENIFLYHQQEALWNKIFIEYMGEKEMEEMMIKNLDKGFIELT